MASFLQKDKNFIYKGRLYPIDFELLTRRSQFFFERRTEYNNIKNIEISDDGIEIPEDSIKEFISFCQFEQNEIHITKTNAFSLRHLAITYKVPGLIETTDNYITKNNKNLVIQSLIYNSQHDQPDVTDENYISKHFFDYIHDPYLFELPITVLYRILNNPNMPHFDDDDHKNQIFDFMFQCLDKYKRPASILFQNFDLDVIDFTFINRLLNEYEDVFDFNMLNAKTNLKKASEMMSEINKIKLEQSIFYSDVQSKFDFFQAKINDLINIVNNQNREIDELKETICLQNKEINDLKESNSLEISSLKELVNDQNNNLQQNITTEKNEIEKELISLKEAMQNIQNNIAQQVDERQLFVTKDHLRQVLQAGREKTREISFWVNDKTWTNPEGKWSNGIACIGDSLNNWINDRKNLHWNAFEPWDAAIRTVPS